MANVVTAIGQWLNSAKGKIIAPKTLTKYVFDEDGKSVEERFTLINNDAGNTIDVTLNKETYEMTVILKNKNGEELSSKTVDFPMELAFVNASYVEGQKKITFTLQSGAEVEVPLAKLIEGLVNTEDFNAAIDEIKSNIPIYTNLIEPYDTNSPEFSDRAGIEVYVYANGSKIELCGTATEDVSFCLCSNIKIKRAKGNPLKLVGCPKGGSSTTYCIRLVQNDSNTYYDYGNGVEIPVSNYTNTYSIYIDIKNGTVIGDDGLVFCLMLTNNINAKYEYSTPYMGSYTTLTGNLHDMYDKTKETYNHIRSLKGIENNIGLYKNMIILNFKTFTDIGLTFSTVLTNERGTFTINGTSTNTTTKYIQLTNYFKLQDASDMGGGNIYSSFILTGSTDNVNLCLRGNLDARGSADIRTGLSKDTIFSVYHNNEITCLCIAIKPNSTFDNVTVKPALSILYDRNNINIDANFIEGYGYGGTVLDDISNFTNDIYDINKYVGKCKNYCKIDNISTTQNGVTVISDNDGIIHVTGTASENLNLNIGSINISKSKFGNNIKVTATKDGENETLCILKMHFKTQDKTYYIDNNVGSVINLVNDNEEVDLILYIPGSKTFNDYLIKPMVTTNLNAIYDDFVPYISDNDTLVEDIVDMKNDVSSLYVSVNNDIAELNSNLDTLEFGENSATKNLFNVDLIENYYISMSDGGFKRSGDWSATKDYIEIKPNTTYTLSGIGVSGDLAGYAFYDSNKNFIVSTQSNTFTTPDNAKYIRVCTYNDFLTNPQLEEGTQATQYEPYIPSVKMLAEEVDNVNDSLDNQGLLNKVTEMQQGRWNISSGVFEDGIYYVSSKEYISCNGNSNIKLKCDSAEAFDIVFFNGSSFISGESKNGSELLFTTPSNATSFKFNIYNGNQLTPQNIGKIEVYVDNQIDEINSNLDGLEFGEVAGGKNLVTVSSFSTKNNEIIFTKKDDSTLIANGSNHNAGVGLSNKFLAKAGITYTAQIITDLQLNMFIWNSDEDILVVAPTSSKEIPFSVTKDTHISIAIDTNNVVFNNTEIKLQLEEGSVATDYEPYIPSVKMLADNSDTIIGDINKIEKDLDIARYGEFSGSKNLFDERFIRVMHFSYNSYSGNYCNEITDTRTYFMFSVSFLDYSGTGIDNTGGMLVINKSGRYSITKAIPTNAAILRIKHNGTATDIILMEQYISRMGLNPGDTITVSMYVTGINPSVQHGLSLSSIQIEKGDKMTKYERYVPSNRSLANLPFYQWSYTKPANQSAAWHKIIAINSCYNRIYDYWMCNLMITGNWYNSKKSNALFNICCINGKINIVQIAGKYGDGSPKIRVVKNATNKVTIEIYCGSSKNTEIYNAIIYGNILATIQNGEIDYGTHSGDTVTELSVLEISSGHLVTLENVNNKLGNCTFSISNGNLIVTDSNNNKYAFIPDGLTPG